MSAQVSNLANIMRLKQRAGQRFVLMLGAGASISSGVPPTTVMMQQLLDLYGKETPGRTVKDRFDELWRRSPGGTRQLFLKDYLDRSPSVGYAKLAALIKAGYFDLVLTFNFDNLVEKALKSIAFSDYHVIIQGETREDAMQKLIDAKEPRVKLAKLHGSLASADYFLFSDEEMHRYPESIEALLQRETSNDIIVCGYSFRDRCVQRAFSEQGELVVSVDREAPPTDLRFYMKNRRSVNWTISAYFDAFFTDLHRELLEAPKPDQKPALNPFKFLQSYEANDKDSLPGRDDETQEFDQALMRKARVSVIAAPGRAWETAFV